MEFYQGKIMDLFSHYRTFFKILPLLGIWSAWLAPPLWPQGETYVWVGAGTAAGQTLDGEDIVLLPGRDNDWYNLNNWEVDGVTPEEAIGADDTAVVIFDQNAPTGEPIALFVPNGAVAARIQIEGGTNNRYMQIGEADGELIELGSLQITANQSGRQWQLAEGVTLRLTGSGTGNNDPTWRVGRSNSSDVMESGSLLELTNETLVRVNNSWTGPFAQLGTVRFTGEEAEIVFTNAVFRYRSGDPDVDVLSFRSDQTITGLGTLLIGGRLESATGDPLNQMGGVLLTMNHNNTRGSDGFVPSGTYRAIDMTDVDTNNPAGQAISAAGSPVLHLEGNMELTGTFTASDAIDYALYVGRNRSGAGGTPEVDTQGHDLVISSTGVTRVGGDENHGRLSIQGSSVSVAGDFHVGIGGQVRGDEETILILGGNWENESERETLFDLSQSTVIVAGNGTEELPQYFDVRGADLGATTDGMIDNFAIGILQVGTNEIATYVELVDLHDFSGNGADALYLGELLVEEESVLFTGEIPVYVDGVLLEVLLEEGTTDFGPGTIVIPEPALAALLLPAFALLYLRRRAQPSLVRS